jgi:hypothetical protein
MMPAEDLRGLGDVLLDREAGTAEVRSAFCSLLSLRPEQVAVLESFEEVSKLEGDAKILCLVVRLTGGDFPTLLSVNADLLADVPRIQTAVRLCQLLRCRCLVDDGSVNPFAFLLVDGTGESRRVGVDPGRGDRDEYVIQRAEPRP